MVASLKVKEFADDLTTIVERYREDHARQVYHDESVAIPIRYDAIDRFSERIRMSHDIEPSWGIRLTDDVYLLPQSRPDGTLAVKGEGQYYVKMNVFDLGALMTGVRRFNAHYPDESLYDELIASARRLAAK